MSLGVLLGATSTYLAFKSTGNVKDNLFMAAWIGSFYCAAGLSAIFYPGTDWKDPGTEEPGQKYLFSGIVVAQWVGYLLETRVLGQKNKTL